MPRPPISMGPVVWVALFVSAACGRTDVSALSPVSAESDADALAPDAGEPPSFDAGGPAPFDAGLPSMPDAGSAGCTNAAQCGDGNRIALGCVGAQVQSCIEGQCLTECRDAARTCSVVSGGPADESCLACDDGAAACVNFCAAANVNVPYQVEQTTCDFWPSSGLLVQGSHLLSSDLRGPTCSSVFRHADTDLELGRYDLLQSFEYLANFPELGGTCTGVMLPTGLERLYFGCPRCSITLVRL